MAEKLVREINFPFYGAGGPPAAGSPNGQPWVKRDTSAAGAPTALGANLGGIALTLDNTSEAQIIGIDMDDVLPFDIDDLIRVEWMAKLDATPGTNVRIVMGMAGAYNGTPDTVAQNAWFLLLGGAATVLCESDDGTNDNDDKTTGLTLSTSFKRFAIDFSTGVQTRQPPNASIGGKANVLFYMGDANSHLIQVCKSTLFDMSNYSSGLQPYFQIQKSSGTATGTLTIKDLCVTLKA